MGNDNQSPVKVGDLVEWVGMNPWLPRSHLHSSNRTEGIITEITILSYTSERICRVYWLDIQAFGECYMEELRVVSEGRGSRDI
jgi:hypothetical protein|tara:strand:+ start:3109 stop:3360 length:252 start_codon:yes stop_codon:yes gene_type:complete